MSKTKQALWTKFGGKEFFARMAENATNDGEGNEISKTYATKDVATTTADGLLSKDDKAKLNNIAEGAQVNKIESISANGTALSPDGHKNVDIPLATSEVDGLLPHEKFPLIPAAPVAGADRIYSFDDDTGTSWQQIVKEYVGNMILDQLGNPVTDEEGEIMYEEEAVPLWLSYKGVEFGARRAYDDHTGANIHDSIASRTTMAQVTTAIDTALANYGGFVVVNSLVDGHPDVQNPSERFIYLYKDSSGPVQDPYTEWIYTANHTWEVIGTTYIDISDVAHKVAGGTDGNIPKLDSNGDLVDSGVAAASLTSKAAVDGGTDLSLVTTGEKFNWNTIRAVPASTSDDEDKVLAVDDQGDTVWKAFDSDVFGTQLIDEHDQPILDEESTPGNPIYVYDANSTDELLTGFAGKGFGAIRAYADQDGNNIKETYVKHADVPDMNEVSTNDIDAMFNISGQAIIGGHRYKTVTIGNQEWMAENLDYKFAYNGGTLPLNVDGEPTTPAAWYCQRNEREYGTEGIYNCGLYYNWYAVKYLDDNTATLLSDGWHVATADDWKTLVRTLGYTLVDGSAYCGGVLSAKNNSVTSDWPSDWNGTDDYGFNITPCGVRAYANTSEWYSRFGLDAYFWTPSALGDYRYMVSVYNNGKLQLGTAGSSTWTDGQPIRLVRTIS